MKQTDHCSGLRILGIGLAKAIVKGRAYLSGLVHGFSDLDMSQWASRFVHELAVLGPQGLGLRNFALSGSGVHGINAHTWRCAPPG